MCESNDQIGIRITRHISVDRCLAQEILFLNDQGVRTINCCCGHNDPKLTPHRHIMIFHQDEDKARAMGYEVVPTKLSDGTIDHLSVTIMPKSVCE